MKNYLVPAGLILFVFLIHACEKTEWEKEVFTVEVLGVGMDCGDTYLIQFREEDEQKINRYLENTNAYFPVFYAVNLPEEYKEKGLFLNITLGKCTADDVLACTTLGPGYSHVCISSAETISIASE